nr:hypothetical protein [uncultured Desulfobulbus sp.]
MLIVIKYYVKNVLVLKGFLSLDLEEVGDSRTKAGMLVAIHLKRILQEFSDSVWGKITELRGNRARGEKGWAALRWGVIVGKFQNCIMMGEVRQQKRAKLSHLCWGAS